MRIKAVSSQQMPQVSYAAASKKLNQVIKDVKGFAIKYWPVVAGTLRSIGGAFKAINVTTIIESTSRGLNTAAGVLGTFSFFSMIANLKDIPYKFKQVIVNITDRGKDKGSVGWAIADTVSTVFSTARDALLGVQALSVLNAFAEIPVLNVVVAPLTIATFGYTVAKKVHNVFHSVKFLKEVKGGKKLSDYKIEPLDKTKLERNTDVKVVKIMENLQHVSEEEKQAKIKSILQKKITLNIVDSIIKTTMIICVIATLIFGVPVLVVPIVGVIGFVFSLVEAGINYKTDKDFQEWYDRVKVTVPPAEHLGEAA